MNGRVSIFECSSTTYADCVQKGLFGSNLPWPLEVKKGDKCFLYHYEVGSLFGVWEADCDGGRKLVPKAWQGRFPFQVRVKLITPEIVEIPKAIVRELIAASTEGRLDHILAADRAKWLLGFAEGQAGQPCEGTKS